MIKELWYEIVARICYILVGLLLAISGLISPRFAEIFIAEMGKAVRNFK